MDQIKSLEISLSAAQREYEEVAKLEDEASKIAKELLTKRCAARDALMKSELALWWAKFEAYPQVVLTRTAGHTTESERCMMHLFSRYIRAELVAKKFAVSTTTVRVYANGVWNEQLKTLTYTTQEKWVRSGRFGYWSGGESKVAHLT